MDLTIFDYNWQEAIDRFSEQWSTLLQGGNFNLSLSPGWIDTFKANMKADEKLRVLIAVKNKRLVGVLPYFEHKTSIFKIPMLMIELAGNIISYHPRIVADNCETELLFELLNRANKKWHVFRILGLESQNSTEIAVCHVVKKIKGSLLIYPGDASPYLPINGSWESYLQSKSSNFRYNLKRKEKKISNAGRFEVRFYNSSSDLDEIYSSMISIESNSWKTEANIAITSHQYEVSYYKKLLPFLAKMDALFAVMLFLDSIPIAYFLCYFWNNKIGNIKTSFDHRYNNLSPGAVVIHHAILKAFEIGAEEVDFLGGAQYHKMLWTEHFRHYDDYYLFSNDIRSQIVARLKQIINKQKSLKRLIVGAGSDMKNSK